MYEENYSFRRNEVRESKKYRDSNSKLSVSNEDFYSGYGCIHIGIESIHTGVCLGFWLNNYNNTEIEELKSIFRPVKTTQQSIIHTTSETFSIDNKPIDKELYKIGINKLVITSSGRSSSGMSIILSKYEIEEICDILCGLTQIEIQHKRRKK